MRNKPSVLLSSLLIMAFPVLAAAGSVVVPPPAPPAGVANSMAPQKAPVSASAPTQVTPGQQTGSGVLPPDSVSSAKPADSLRPSSELIDVMLPAAPERPPGGDLKPAPPKRKGKPAKKGATRDAAMEDTQPTRVDDPFMGIANMPVSDVQLNRFVFKEPIEGIYFPEGTPLPECPKDAGAQDPCKPVFLNDRHMVLVQFRAGARGPIQMLVNLHSGRMVTLNLAPMHGPGAVIRVDGAEDGPSDARLAEEAADRGNAAGGLEASEQDVALLSRFARGEIPAGFEPATIGKPRRYDRFDAIPMATWTNGANLRVHLLQVKAFDATPVVVNAGLFRGPRIKAVALDHSTVTENKPALLYLLEQLPAEAQ